jgi:hypothetical protein
MRAERGDASDHLVTGHTRRLYFRTGSFDVADVGAADAASFYFDQHFAGARCGCRTFH